MNKKLSFYASVGVLSEFWYRQHEHANGGLVHSFLRKINCLLRITKSLIMLVYTVSTSDSMFKKQC